MDELFCTVIGVDTDVADVHRSLDVLLEVSWRKTFITEKNRQWAINLRAA